MPEWITKYWVQWIFGVITSILAAGYAKLSKKFKDNREEQRKKAEQDAREMQALKDGMRSILRRQIIQDCEKAIAEKHCTVDSKSTINNMYESFKALGDESAIKQLVDTVVSLPTL